MGHKLDVYNIAWLARDKPCDVFAKWWPESLLRGQAVQLSRVCDLVGVVQNPGFKNFLTTSNAMKEAIAGSAPAEMLHAVLGAIVKDLAHIKGTFEDYKATLPPDWDVIRLTSPAPHIGPHRSSSGCAGC